MDIQGLRCGDYAAYYDEIARIKTVDSRTNTVTAHALRGWEICCNADVVSPIRLDLDTLRACGFTQTAYSTYRLGLPIDSAAGAEIEAGYSGGFTPGLSVWRLKSAMGRCVLPKSPECLHELQNLYRAVSGCELEIDTETLKSISRDKQRDYNKDYPDRVKHIPEKKDKRTICVRQSLTD